MGVGTPEDLKANTRSHTGRALRDYEETLGLERYAASDVAKEKHARYAAVEDARYKAEGARDDSKDGPSLQSLVSKRRRVDGRQRRRTSRSASSTRASTT